MRKRHARATCLGPVAILLAVVILPSAALAGSDFDDKGFGLRLPPAFIRFRQVTAMGGETAASRFSSAINPASADWSKVPGKYRLVIAPYYSAVIFSEGPRIDTTSQTLNWQSLTWGTFQPTLAQIRSNNETTRDKLDFDYTVDVYQVQWGKRVGDAAIGFNFNYSSVELKRRTTVPFIGDINTVNSTSESYRFRVGGLYQPREKWLTGVAFEYGFAPYRSILTLPRGFGFVQRKVKGVAHQFVLRPGVSYEYAERSTIYADYQLGAFVDGNNEFWLNRFFVGVEHAVTEWLCLRANGSMDHRGNLGGSVGIGAHVSEFCSFDFGYNYNMYPELGPEFGRSQGLQFILALRI